MDSESDGFLSLTEGSATIYYPKSSPEEVFYNPVQEYNRDLSIAAIQRYLRIAADEDEKKEKFKILEALSATGLRSIRYANEIERPRRDLEKPVVPVEIVANDLSLKAFKSIQRNVKANKVEDLVKPSHSDATDVMYKSRGKSDRFQVVDLDPYGSPAVFLDGAVQAVDEGGLLCVTCTDVAILCGNAPESCYSKYGAVSLKSKACHEMALRIVLQCIEGHANRYSRYIVPLMSLSIDFYVRIFVRVFTSQKRCKKTTSKLGHVFQCTGCESITCQPLGNVTVEGNNLKYKLPNGPPVGQTCQHCQRPFKMGGPFWLDPIHDPNFVKGILDDLAENPDKFKTAARMRGMLTMAVEELIDVPFYYQQDRLFSMVKAGSSKIEVLTSALLNSGYQVSLSHANRRAVKTDAPNSFIWKMMRAYTKKIGNQPEKLPGDSIAFKLCQGEEEEDLEDVNFDIHEAANPGSRSAGLVRFQPNPLPHWGPKMRAHGNQLDLDSKRKRNQGKNDWKKEGNESDSKKSKLDDITN